MVSGMGMDLTTGEHKDMLMATLGCLAWSRYYLGKKPTAA